MELVPGVPSCWKHSGRETTAPVLSYPSGEFAVIVSEYNHSDAKLEEKHVLEHARVVSVSSAAARFCRLSSARPLITMKRCGKPSAAIGVLLARAWPGLRGKAEMHIKLVVRDGSFA